MPHKPDSLMSVSTDVLSTRRAISASRLRPNPQGKCFFLYNEKIFFFN